MWTVKFKDSTSVLVLEAENVQTNTDNFRFYNGEISSSTDVVAVVPRGNILYAKKD